MGGEAVVVVAAVGAGGIVAAVADRNVIRSFTMALGFSNTGTVPVSFSCTSASLFCLSSDFITLRRALAFFRPCCRSFLARFMSRGAVVAMCLICVRSRIVATRLGTAWGICHGTARTGVCESRVGRWAPRGAESFGSSQRGIQGGGE